MLGKRTNQRTANIRVVEVPRRRPPRPADPCAMVIFGAAGDLTRRLVVPALYNLARTGMLPRKFSLIGADLAKGTTATWRDGLRGMLESFIGNPAAEFKIDRIDEAAWRRLAETTTYIRGDLTKPDLYADIRAVLDKAEKAHGTRGNVLFYLAIADRFFGTVVDELGKAKLTGQAEDKQGNKR